MKLLTPLVKRAFVRRYERLMDSASRLESVQRGVLAGLLRRAASTAVGRRYGFGSMADYEQFAAAVPLHPYEDIRPEVMRMVSGEADVLWPGECRRYAQSSGTSDGRSKFIPVTDESLRRCHYPGAAAAVECYLAAHNPQGALFDGRSFILGGSFATDLTGVPAHVRVGDLSASLIEAINPLVNLLRVPSRRTALMADWTAKLPALVAEAGASAAVTNISGVPSWFLTVLKEILAARGAQEMHQVWPRLEVFFHGGISFEPYREQYNAIIDPARMHYVETYNASEGFFAVQDSPAVRAMLLLPDNGVFYEFQPLGGGKPVPAWEVEQGRVYSLIITACNGLWRYPLGDTVRIHSVAPLRVTIAGRTKSFINAFGEELMVHNADAALAATCRELRCTVADYHAAPVYADCRTKGHHQWLVEFVNPPQSLAEFAATLDRHLCEVNSDYAAKRSGSIFLAPLELTVAPKGLFNRYLAATGKLGGQRKVPRLANDRSIMDRMLEMAANR